jgi:hypothetical protein
MAIPPKLCQCDAGFAEVWDANLCVPCPERFERSPHAGQALVACRETAHTAPFHDGTYEFFLEV